MSGTDHGFDTDRLATYLEVRVSGFRGALTAEKFAGGQSNPTFFVQAASGRNVLRRKPPGELLKSAHAVDREYRVLEALHGSTVPVAKPFHPCTDDGVIGSWFYLMDHGEGRVFWNPTLPELDNAQRRAVYDEMNRVLATTHLKTDATRS